MELELQIEVENATPGMHDVLIGGVGNDELKGGAGVDTIDFSDLDTSLDVELDTGDGKGSAISDSSGMDTVSGVENIIAGSGNDDLRDGMIG